MPWLEMNVSDIDRRATKPSRIRFSTDDLPKEARFSAWSDGFVHRRMEMDFIDRSTDGLRFSVDFIPLGGIAAGLVRGTPSSFIRRPEQARDGNDGLFMIIVRAGGFRVVQQGEAHHLAPGDAALFDNRRENEFHSLEEGETWSISLPREALRHLVRDIDGSIEQRIPAAHPTLRLLVGYLETLFSLDEVNEPELAGVHVADLVASALGPRKDTQSLIEERGVRAARLRAVLEAIAKDAANSDLDPGCIAAGLGFSVRYLHRLLQDSGKTFSEHVLDRRIENALRLLRDPRLVGRKISEIAMDCGFADLSHFNRSFRRRFGKTPSAVRAEAALRENG
jgi:AraC-like DNA-binding protein